MSATAPSPDAARASLVEIYSAIQGEGPYVGQRQVFVRLLGCDIRCAYCDTPDTHVKVREARVEQTAGRRDWAPLSNPAAVADVRAAVTRLDHPRGLHRWVALTGGEPLLYAAFLEAFLPALKTACPLPVYLETHGLAVEAMERLAPSIAYVSMDWKIASATREPVQPERHHAFLRVLAARDVAHFVKLVVAPETTAGELEEAARLINDVDRATVTVLQPVTPYGPVTAAPTPEQLLEWQALLSGRLDDVRVIPQTHVALGQL
jgi:organic radical activating enzyme